MWENLKKVIQLIEKTGDKCVILGENQPPFVIMNFNDYEKLNFRQDEISSLSQRELLDKINRQIAVWRTSNKSQEINIDDLGISENISDNKPKNIDDSSDLSQIVEDKKIFGNLEAEHEEDPKENDEYFIEPLD